MMDEKLSWAIKDEAVLKDLVTLMNFSDDEKTALAALKDKAQASTDALADDFYGRLLTHAPTAEYLEGMVDHLKEKLGNWFVDLFSGSYDETYVRSRLQIGKTHVRIGLPVRYPLATMDVMLKHGHAVVGDDPQAQAAFTKLLALDIAIFNQAYEDTQLKHLAEMVGNERLARRLLTQEASV